MPIHISSNKVRARMAEAGLNSTQLSQRSTLSPSTIDRILNSRASSYSEFTVNRLASALGCSKYDLYSDESIASGIADSAASDLANVVVEAVADAVSVVADDVAPNATPEDLAKAIPDINVTTPPAFDLAAYFDYIKESHKDELSSLRSSYTERIEEAKREKRTWFCMSCALMVIIIAVAAWLIWEFSNFDRGLTGYYLRMLKQTFPGALP